MNDLFTILLALAAAIAIIGGWTAVVFLLGCHVGYRSRRGLNPMPSELNSIMDKVTPKPKRRRKDDDEARRGKPKDESKRLRP